MSHCEPRVLDTIGRRSFLRTSIATMAGSATIAASWPAAAAAPPAPAPLLLRRLGKTGPELPILAYGGAALPREWGNPLSTEDRIQLVRYAYDRGIRCYDTADNYMDSQVVLGAALQDVRDDVFLISKVETTEPDEVRGAVEKSLRDLRTDYLDAVLIHGTPGLEQMTVERALRIHAELIKLRDEGLVKLLGLSAHSYYDKALALIATGGFELCMLSYGYIPRGDRQLYTARMTELRNQCLAQAHDLGMGIIAMKVIAAGMLGAGSARVVPDFDPSRAEQLPAAAIRFALDDERIQLLVIGMRVKSEIDANIETLQGDLAYTVADRALLAEFSLRAYESDTLKAMRVD